MERVEDREAGDQETSHAPAPIVVEGDLDAPTLHRVLQAAGFRVVDAGADDGAHLRVTADGDAAAAGAGDGGGGEMALLEVLHRLGLEVAARATPERVFALAARETAALFGADAAVVVRYEGRHALVVGTYGGHSRLGERLPATGHGVLARVAATRAPARIDDYADLDEESPLRTHALARGYRASVGAPVKVGGELWGAVLVTTRDHQGLPAGLAGRLARFAELVALAVDNAQTHAELRRLASTDGLTRLPNRRAFEERLEQEVTRAHRHGRDLSLVVLDLDHFKQVNDAHGHPVGDRVLVEFAERLRRLVRQEDFVGRMGGEEFAWLMPEAPAGEALRAAERLRLHVAGRPFSGAVALTVSGGVCDLGDARGAAELYRLADEALFWAKGRGRNQIHRYTAGRAAEETSRSAPVRSAERQHTVRGVRALARAVDAKDPATRLHSERVADLAVRLAIELGWAPDMVSALGEAALVHDVGKIGVPDAVLLKPGPLTVPEREQVIAHAALGGLIASDVLSSGQAGWVRSHHERWGGGGYPDDLRGDEIPAGALIIALADAVDVMCSARVYAPARTWEEALAECRREAGRQFAPWAVDALTRLGTPGSADPVPPR